MKELLGKTITKVQMLGNDYIAFTTDTGKVIEYDAYGDCCSISWFAHIDNLKALIGNKINSVEARKMWTKEEIKKAESEGDYEVLALYGYLLKTNKGTCDIEFRNDSNGYYGGSADLITLSKKQRKELKTIKKDF